MMGGVDQPLILSVTSCLRSLRVFAPQAGAPKRGLGETLAEVPYHSGHTDAG